MKAVFVFLVGFLLANSTRGQMGQVIFANSAATLLTTNSCAANSFPPNSVPTVTGPMSGSRAYRIGLYVAPFAPRMNMVFRWWPSPRIPP